MSKIIQTPQQRANTLEAINLMWPSVPPENVCPDLSDFRMDKSKKAPHCKTIACFGGWCAWWPNFVRQGIKAADGGIPVVKGSVWASDASRHLFGSEYMFVSRGCSNADVYFHGSDHELVTHRLQWLLDNSEVTP